MFKVKGLGELGSSHTILQLVALDFLSFWCCSCAMFGDNRYLLFFQEKYQLTKLLKGKELERFTKYLHQRLKVSLDVDVSNQD